MKRSRRVVLTMMGTAAIGAVSTGFVRPIGCGPDEGPELRRDRHGRLREYCRASYGGFGGAPYQLHGHFHGGHAHGGG